MAGERDTPQRRAIRKVLEGARRPLNPREVLQNARRTVDTLGIATVYRTLNGLVADGWLVTVELPGEAPRYERSGKAHHHHFVCDGCGRVYEVSGCPAGIDDIVPDGFSMKRHELVLYGVCPRCGRQG